MDAFRTLPALLLTALPLAVAAPSEGLAAQDGFGRAVAVDGEEALILKPAPGHGPAALYVYRPDGGAWELVDRLPPPGAGETGEGYSPSLAAGPGGVWVASGDPAVRWAAHVFARRQGRWEARDRVPFDPERAAAPGPAALDLAGLMRILQPAPRVVAVDGERALVAVAGGPGSEVRVVESDDRVGARSVLAPLQAPAVLPQDGFGAALAIRDGLAFVGAPRHGGRGAVFVFGEDDASGGWSLVATVEPTDSVRGAGFGSSLALDGGRLAVGAPGAGVVVVFGRNERTGSWSPVDRIASPGEDGDGFGTALAVRADELWVGAPDGGGGRGVVHRYRRGEAGGSWQADAEARVLGPAVGSGFGASLAVGEEVAVAGAPDADGWLGRAAVFVRDGTGGWGTPAWLGPGGDLTAVTGGEVACAEGRAAHFRCDNVDLLAFLPIDALGGGSGETVSECGAGRIRSRIASTRWWDGRAAPPSWTPPTR